MAIELLAPAGNIDIARSAIMSGADAVYIGSPSFGARKSASNSMEDIARLVDYAHIFGVKVYLTMNTILFDDELDEASSIAFRAEEIGVDALIVQDMAYLKFGLKRIPFHASTQTFNFDLDRIKKISSSGFDRIVLERSLSLAEIKRIRENISIEIECFIHGAMCVGYSGRCYLSQFLCGRSGNRGVCSQPCRSDYKLKTESGRIIEESSPVLSVSDIDFSDRISNLADAGVSSLKIEGRLKDQSYVINNVSYYNSILNSLGIERTSYGNITCSFTPNPRKSFSRGISGHMFLDDARAKVGASTRSLGEKIGVVEQITSNVVRISPFVYDLHNGDGICWISGSKQYGTYINGVNNNCIVLSSAQGLKKGDTIYRNYDKKFNPTSKDVSRKLSFSLSVGYNNDLLSISAQDFSKSFNYDFIEAKNANLARNNIISSFSKAGEFPFVITSVSLNFSKVPFFPQSLLNSIRRDFFSSYLIYLKSKYPLNMRREKIPENLSFPSSLSFEWNVSNKLSRQFYEEHGSSFIEPALELQNQCLDKVIMISRHCIRRQRNLCPKDNPSVKIAQPLIIENNGKQIRIIFECSKCQMKLVTM